MTPAYIDALDAADELASFRNQFSIPTGTIYLDGNSLGLHSKSADESLQQVVEDWRRFGVAGWTDADPPWFGLAEQLGAATAELVGAFADEVIVANSTTVNLHQLLATLLPARLAGGRCILTDCFAFPSDAYAIESFLFLLSQCGMSGACRKSVNSRDGYLLDEEDIIEAMTPEVAAVILPSVVYTSGQLLDMERLTSEARFRNLLIGFDCSHSIGSVPHLFSEWGVDFAFWCGYKYLNGGPGASGGLYLNRRHHGKSPGLAGWFSSRKETQLRMEPNLAAAGTAGALQIGTPNILSMAPLIGSISTVNRAGINRIRAKSLAQTRLIADLAMDQLGEFGVRVVTPHEDQRRGGHVALGHPQAVQICKALKAAGVVPDYRPPDIVRLAPVALYTRYAECADAIAIFRDILANDRQMEHDPLPEIVP